MKNLTLVVLMLLSASAQAAEPCEDNFKAEGNLIVGKVYSTSAVLLDVPANQAFDAAYAFTTAHGFTVLSSNKDSGTISAVQTDVYTRGKRVPLNIQVQPDHNNVRIGMNYIVTGLMYSPEDAIKRHFCLTIAAANQPGTATAKSTPMDQAAPSSGAGAPAPTGRVVRRALPGFAAPTPEQLEGYRSAVLKNVANDRVRQLAKDAAPAIAAYIERLACVNDYQAARALNEFAAPQVQLTNQYMMVAPAMSSNYHDKSACLSVLRVNGWTAPANNALDFEAVYKADDSGQTVKVQHEAVRQPDGTWLFTR